MVLPSLCHAVAATAGFHKDDNPHKPSGDSGRKDQLQVFAQPVEDTLRIHYFGGKFAQEQSSYDLVDSLFRIENYYEICHIEFVQNVYAANDLIVHIDNLTLEQQLTVVPDHHLHGLRL